MRQQTEHICALAAEKPAQRAQFAPACLFPLAAAAFVNALSHTQTSWAARGVLGRRVCCTGMSACVGICEQVCQDQTRESAFLGVLQNAHSWTRLCIFTGIRHMDAYLSPWLIPCWFSAHTVKVRLVHGKIRALVSAATGMFLCQLLPCFFRRSQALPGFQMATGFQASSALCSPLKWTNEKK